MIIDASFKQRLREQPQIGCFVTFPSPAIAEFTAHLGFDFTLIDGEHSAMDSVAVEDMVRASQCAGVPAMVRVAYNRPDYIRRPLDSGAHGVQVPLINTVGDARAAIAPSKFAPDGDRGVAFLTRAAQYGTEAERATYFERANQARVLSLHVETVEAVRNLDAILDAGGADVYFVGPGDLAVSMGFGHDPGNAQVWSTIERCIRTIKARGFVAGTLVTDVARTRQAIEWGANYIVTSISPFIIQGAASYLRSVRAC